MNRFWLRRSETRPRFLHRLVLGRYEALLLRLSNLETALECLIESPRWADSDDVGFNGQRIRKQTFLELLAAFPFEAILETGTWIGNTAGYMAERSRLPVYTCELDRRFVALAKTRLQEIPNVHVTHKDSRSFLRAMSRSELASKLVFFYLDAHWYKDLPLREELSTICDTWRNFVVMIDDFQVPDDDGYHYDVYEKTSLDLKLISDILDKHELTAFFPASPSGQESGFQRGCVVLTRSNEFSGKLSKVPLLRQGTRRQ